ncbi:MAG: UDP-3-O-acyl-N-acetylglucosamine deacetylase [Bacteroidales bacterium]|jgi:UDP-3-O-[3-hydroxymyristoyl] N-acetylglucosamine deacetylase/3-hydroxyacyl-[acyl-carrier-protein] dehydratase
MKQHTVLNNIELNGVGLHTGEKTAIRICPAPEWSGIRFQRMDIPRQPVLEALADYVVNTNRSTVLSKDNVTVGTTEHLLSAFFGMGIDNALVQIWGGEIPVLDGSALPFAHMIKETGLAMQHADREYITISEPITFTDNNSGTVIEITPSEQLKVHVIIDFNSRVLGKQEFIYTEDTDFFQEIAASRTFVFLHEVLALFQKGLVKGGDLENALVISEKEISPEELESLRQLYNKPKLDINEGYLNESGLRFPDECARHKTMDLLGDLMLAGKRIRAVVRAYKPGHAANAAVAGLIRKQMK